mgnify:CR=1 FL=1
MKNLFVLYVDMFTKEKPHRKSVRFVKHQLPSSKSRAEKKHGLLNM